VKIGPAIFEKTLGLSNHNVRNKGFAMDGLLGHVRDKKPSGHETTELSSGTLQLIR